MNGSTCNGSVVAGLEQVEVPSRLDDGWGPNGRLGLVVLATDQTIEWELQLVLAPQGVGVFGSRVLMETDVNPTSLAALKQRIAEGRRLILPGMTLDVVGFCCTSASSVIGEEAVFKELSTGPEDPARFTTPITAALAAFRSLGVKHLGLLTPYVGQVNEIFINYVHKHSQVKIVRLWTFNLSDDRDVAAVSQDSMVEQGVKLAKSSDVDAIFISCTNLRVTTIVSRIEAESGKACTGSNHALAWHALRLMNHNQDLSKQWGKLFSKQIVHG